MERTRENLRKQDDSAAEDTHVTPAMFAVFLALADGPRHGLGIIEEVEARTGNEVTLSIGTLYRTISRLTAAGLIAPTPRPSADDNPRRNYYRLTDPGRAVLRREAQRVDRLARWARSVKAVPRLV
jgi:DNA-binding PadR family transcriptional regulator